MKNRSFTIIELLVVIAVIGLIATIVLINLRGLGSEARIIKSLEFSQSINNALGSHLVGYWSFDDQTNPTKDGSGYGDECAINAPVTFSSDTPHSVAGTGTGRYSLSFDGVGNYVNCGHPARLQITDRVTYEAWIKVNSLGSGDDTIMARYWSPNLWLYGGERRITFSIDLGSGNAAFAYGPKPSLATWHHVVGTYDRFLSAQNLKIYVNGKLEGTADFTQPLYNTEPKNVAIGKLLEQDYTNFSGLIDEARIYETALSLGEIRQHYAEGLKKRQIAIE